MRRFVLVGCVAAALALAPARARAQEPVTASPTGVAITSQGATEIGLARSTMSLRVYAGYGGLYRPGHWTPIDVVVVARPSKDLADFIGETLKGTLRVTVGTGPRASEVHTVPIEVTMPGERRVSLLVLPDSDMLQVEFTPDLGMLGRAFPSLRAEVGGLSGRVRLRQADADAPLVGAMPDTENTLRQRTARSGRFTVAELRDQTVPGRANQWFGLDAAVLSLAELGALPPSVQDALLDWVFVGGRLVLTYHGPYAQLPPQIERALPATVLLSREFVTTDAMANFGGVPFAGGRQRFVAVDQLQPRGEVVLAVDDTPLITRRTWGQGTVTLIGTDPGAGPFRDWKGMPTVWARLLPTAPQIESGRARVRDRVLRAVLRFHDISEVGLGGVLLLFSVYAGFIGFGLSWLLRRRGHAELYWPVAGGVVAVIVLITLSSPGTVSVARPAVQTVSFVRARSGTTLGRIETYAVGTSPTTGHVDITTGLPDAGMRTFAPARRLSLEEQVAEIGYDPAPVARRAEVGPTEATLVLTTGVVEGLPPVQFARLDPKRFRLRNATGVMLTNVTLVLPEGSAILGNLLPGEERVVVPTENDRYRTWSAYGTEADLIRLLPGLLRLLPQAPPGVPGVFHLAMTSQRDTQLLGAVPDEATMLAWWPQALVAAGEGTGALRRRGHTLLAYTPEEV